MTLFDGNVAQSSEQDATRFLRLMTFWTEPVARPPWIVTLKTNDFLTSIAFVIANYCRMICAYQSVQLGIRSDQMRSGILGIHG